MQDKKSFLNKQDIQTNTSISKFLNNFSANSFLRQANIKKIRGVAVKDIITPILMLSFRKKNFFQGIVNDPDIRFSKSVAYDFLNNHKYNWRKFMLSLISFVIRTFINPLTYDEATDVLIIDDTPYSRNRSKKVELLARVFDHVTMKFFKGFRIMQLGWSDGNSFLPIDFALLSSEKEKNRYNEANEKIDKRSCGGRRRQEAVSKSTSLIVPMLKRAFTAGIKAKYLLMDSWYGMPSIIVAAKEYIDVICMVKKSSKIHYYVDGKAMTVKNIYKSFRKKRGKAAIKGSKLVQVKSGNTFIDARIVFVKNRSKKADWLAILSTDTNLSEEEVVRLYGRRWDIEVFFKMEKSYLNLTGEISVLSFDAMIAHISIVAIRYVFLTIEQRKSSDGRTFGGMFREVLAELEDITLLESLVRIFGLVVEKMKNYCQTPDDIIDTLVKVFSEILVEKFGLSPNT